MTTNEKEKLLIEEIEFFNKAVQWWSNEFDKVNNEIIRLEKSGFPFGSESKMNKLVATITYLAGKAKTEKRVALDIESKLNKLRLMRDLEFIQGDFNIKKKKKKKKKS